MERVPHHDYRKGCSTSRAPSATSRLSAVLDTSVLIDGILEGRSAARAVIKYAAFQYFDTFATRACLTEYKTAVWSRSLQARYARYGIDTRSVRKILDNVTGTMRLVEETGEFCPIPDDRDDEKFTAAALAAGAEFICSADDHLLSLKTCQSVRIWSAQAVLDELIRRGAVI